MTHAESFLTVNIYEWKDKIFASQHSSGNATDVAYFYAGTTTADDRDEGWPSWVESEPWFSEEGWDG